ncbi:autophagy-related 6 protein [Rutstroemia sp. NJR-2017a BBW]|nr:autophagy-related 6 protein [Rutstroemia sp. NJR-2017a BBW]
MGWLWGSSDGDDKNNNKDPLKNLDPSLREFLAKESPVKYESVKPTDTPAQGSSTSTSPPPVTNATSTTSANEDSAQSSVPAQSLYKDGRYAHLWKTYQPQVEIETAAKSDSEKIQDIIDGYNYRKAQIGRAALENCALEQCDVNECFRSGGWQARLTMCREQNKKLERCYTMQGSSRYLLAAQKFLRALGYLSTFDRPQEVDERIQMHADTLYHRMLDQEQQIEAAKAEGRPVPTFPPLMSQAKSSATQAEPVPAPINNKLQASELPTKVQAQFKSRLEGLSAEEREVEERAIRAEIEAGEQVATQLGNIYKKQDEERRQRKEQGKETISDKLLSIFRANVLGTFGAVCWSIQASLFYLVITLIADSSTANPANHHQLSSAPYNWATAVDDATLGLCWGAVGCIQYSVRIQYRVASATANPVSTQFDYLGPVFLLW